MLVYLYGAAHRGAVAVEATVPEGIAENDLRHAVLTMFLGSMDESAKIGLNAESVEVVPANHVRPDNGRISAASVEPHATLNVIGHQGIKAAIHVAQVTVIQIGLRWRSIRPVSSLHHEQVLGVRHI